MIPFAFFLFAFLLTGIIAFALLSWRMDRSWSREQPSVVSSRLRTGNRILALVALLLLVFLAVMEMLIPSVSYWVVESQYWVGDRLVQELTYNDEVGAGSLSWGLYLGILLGILGGNVAGQYLAIRRYPVLRGITLRSLI